MTLNLNNTIEDQLIKRWQNGNLQFWDASGCHERGDNCSKMPPLQLTWSNISVKTSSSRKTTLTRLGKALLPNKRSADRILLHNAFGVAKNAEVLAILGPSGSGKTMLLNAIQKQLNSSLVMTGDVRINGQSVSQSAIQRISGYIHQDDCLIGTLTTREHLLFVATLKMGRTVKRKEREQRVENALRSLGLKNCENTLIGVKGRVKGISGGERKRLAFASEVLMSPRILFCDEPTTGLDSFHAYEVVRTLNMLAKQKGITILVTVHQPSSQLLELFDRILLMSEGKVVFIGKTSEAITIWANIGRPLSKNYNPADHFLKTLTSTDASKDVHEEYMKSAEGMAIAKQLFSSKTTNTTIHSSSVLIKSTDQKYGTSYMSQLWTLSHRAALTSIRDPLLLKVRLTQTIFSSIIIGGVYLNTHLNQQTIMNYNGALFNLVASMNYLFQFTVIDSFCSEMSVFLREHRKNLYRTSVYFIAKNIAELPQFIILPIIFTTILYWMTGLSNRLTAFINASLIAYLMATVSISIGYATSCIFGNANLALTVLPALTIPTMAVSGFFINVQTLPIYFKFLKYISFFRFSFESLVINQWENIDEIPGCPNGSYAYNNCTNNGAEVITNLGFSVDNFYPDIIGLIVEIVLFRLIAFLALYFRTF